MGLAAYILEKFSAWTHRENKDAEDGNLTQRLFSLLFIEFYTYHVFKFLRFTMDELLDNVMVYWTTNSITSSMRFYAENINMNDKFQDQIMRFVCYKLSVKFKIFFF